MSDTLFLPCSLDGLPVNSGSIRFRAEWPAKYWDGWKADVYDGTQRFDGWDAYVFQKAYRSDRMRSSIVELRERGDAVLVLDMCDPDWLDAESRQKLLEVLPYFDLATCPTKPLADWLGRWVPTYLVEDGIDPDAITHWHEYDPTDSPSVCWIGYKGNLAALSLLYDDIAATGVDVQVVEIDRPVTFDVFLQTLSRFDILLNPRPNVAPYLYKSSNKSLVAWAAGVAVAEKPGDLARLLDPVGRRAALDLNRTALDHPTAIRTARMYQKAIWSELQERP